MDLSSIVQISTAISVIVMAILAVREFRSKRDNTITGSIKNLADALNMSTTELAESVAAAATLRDELDREREETRKRIEETTKHREEQEKQIELLTQQIEGLKLEYEAEAQRLRNENANLRRQVLELQNQHDDMVRKYSSSKHVIERLIKALNDAKIPLPDLNGGDLSDSIRNWKSN